MNLKKIIDRIKKQIDKEEVKIVSFDIFDTLLVRPAINPEDILIFLDDIKTGNGNQTFFELRFKSQREVEKYNKYARIDDFYRYMSEKYSIPLDLCLFAEKMEIEIEQNLLYARKDIKKIYEYALEKGKRIIATSDMYLSTPILKKILIDKGYKNIEEVYVSCDCLKRKDSGELYYYISKKLDIEKKNILHIGDNYKSDYVYAKRVGINSIYFPSTITLYTRNHNNHLDNLLKNSDANAFSKIILGFAINSSEFEQFSKFKKGGFSLSAIGKIGIFPILLKICIQMSFDQDLLRQYSNFYFMARDGYLPMKSYKVFSKYVKNLQAFYIYGSRRAYQYLIKNDAYQLLTPEVYSTDYTIEDYLDSTISDFEYKCSLFKKLPAKEKSFKILTDVNKAKKILEKYEEELSVNFKTSLNISKEYYLKAIQTSKKRVLVFDCGYGGSVSIALGNVLKDKKIDKLYLWQNENNTIRDKINKTKTYTIFTKSREPWFDLFIENIFSPVNEGSCIGFIYDKDKKIVPVYEKEISDDKMKADILNIQDEALNLLESFCNLFDCKYLEKFTNINPEIFIDIIQDEFSSILSSNNKVLKDIKFKDKAVMHKNTCLSTLIIKYNIRKKVKKVLYFWDHR